MTGPEAHAAARELEQQAEHMDTLRDRQQIEEAKPVTTAYHAAKDSALKRAAELRQQYPSALPTGPDCEAYLTAYLKSRGWTNERPDLPGGWKHVEGGMRWSIGGAFQHELDRERAEQRKREREQLLKP